MGRLAGILIAVLALVGGFAFRDQHVRLRLLRQAGDQAVLAHRDSAYTSMTWVASPGQNYLQLRFFDKVEGGYCLRPTWEDLRGLARSDARLAHLLPGTGGEAVVPGEAAWPASLPVPDPGTLPNSAYVRMFPAGLLLAEDLMRRSDGDLRRAEARILVVGLGSGVGIAGLLHHLPLARITVVDIDQQVIASVLERVPLLRWAAAQTHPDGSHRLRLVARDARQYLRFDARREPVPYNLIILDAYTAGSTIPSHLMTREFFGQCAAALAEDGCLLSNVIGSYTGEKHQVLGGALRSMRACGLEQVISIPVIQYPAESPAGFSPIQPRNNIVIASRRPLDPIGNRAGWQRLQAFVPFPELPLKQFTSAEYALGDQDNFLTATVPAPALDLVEPTLSTRLKPLTFGPDHPQHTRLAVSADPSDLQTARRQVALWASQEAARLPGPPLGWDDARHGTLWRIETDWVLAARETWRVSLLAGRDTDSHGGDVLVGPPEGPERNDRSPTWRITDAPLFTDQQPNADILNR